MASCTGKPKFESEVDAQVALRRSVPGIVGTHLCATCNKWHLGQKPVPKVERKIRKTSHSARR